jgi:hypothetical protein
MQGFTHFIGIDWSGAKYSKRNKVPNIEIAICMKGNNTPELVTPSSGEKNWSRREISDWIAGGLGLSDDARILVGIDAAFGFPYLDEGQYFLGEGNVVSDVKSLWALIGRACAGSVDYFGGPFADEYAAHFQQVGGRKGKHYERRMRRAETLCIERKIGPCESVFNLIGASQVGKSAISTICMLHDLNECPDVSIWPFDEIENTNICLVEIYAALFAKLGGHKGKVRDIETLNTVLTGLEAKPYYTRNFILNDNQTDAMITSAGLRYISGKQEYWHPLELSPTVRATEGWIFGIA